MLSNKIVIKPFTFFIFFCFFILQNENLFGKNYLNFFKWNKPDHLNLVKPDIDTIFKFGRIYNGLKNINSDYSEQDFIRDLKKLGFTKKEVQYFESLDLVLVMDKYVKEIRALERTIDPNKIVDSFK
tara:strand:+ start:6207 stop:6587 length:381 start_codon:yes stop_codon:yes gene_type:complete